MYWKIIIWMAIFSRLLSPAPGMTDDKVVPSPQLTIIIGADSAFPPYSWLDEKGVPRGINIEFAGMVAHRAGYQPRFLMLPLPELLQKLETGTIDALLACNMSKYAKQFLFTHTYWTHTPTLWIRKDMADHIQAIKNLKGKKVGVQASSCLAGQLPGIIPGEEKIIQIPSEPEGFRLLKEGKIDAFVGSSYLAGKYIIVQMGAMDEILPVGPAAQHHPVGFILQPSRRLMLESLNEAIDVLHKSGAHDKLVERYTAPLIQPLWAGVRRIAPWAGGTVAFLIVIFWALVFFLRRQVRRVTRELQKSEERFRSLFENASIGIFQTIPEGKVLMANPEILKIYGYTLEEHLSVDITRDLYCHPEDRELFLQKLQKDGVVRGFEHKARRKDGRIITMRMNAWIVRDEEGRTVRIEGTTEDITAQKEAAMAMEASERKYRELVERLDDMVFEVNLEGRLTFANAALESILGYLPDELIGRSWADILEPADVETTLAVYREALRGSYSLYYVNRCLHKDGRSRRLSWSLSPRLDASGAVIGVKGTARDITDQYIAQERIRLLYEVNQLILDNIPMSVLVLGKDLRILRANQRYLDFKGIREENVLGRDIREVLSPLLLEQQNLSGHLEKAAAEGGFVKIGGLKLQLEGQTELYLNFHILGLRFPPGVENEGEEIRVLLLIEDHTRERRLEEQFLLAQKMEAIGRLAGGVAHDFNNLLTAITGYTQLLLIKMDLDHSMRREMEEIQKAADRAADLIRQLLAFSRRQVLEPHVLDLNEVVADMDRMLRRLIGEDIELVTVLAPDLGRIKADRSQVEQIIANLAVNARDAMPTGGILTLETDTVILDEAYARDHMGVTSGQYIMLAVTDTGCGMTREVMEHLFEPFFTTKEIGKGTGLGLATVYGIVNQSGGNIWVYSEPGQGTTFKIYLPRVEESEKAIFNHDEPLSLEGGHETILLVEDEPVVREITCRMLKNLGYSVLEASDGEEAIQRAQEHEGPIDLMITDVVMPQMSGQKLARRLEPSRPDMKVIYISGYTNNVIVKNGLLEPRVVFLQKPYTVQSLATKVRQVLDSSRAEGSKKT
ncbi:MAG: PAS domain S-box protein [Deltaproteobacteria bacterium]|nr:PAS domain S-box protein [Deltaproteobacteria bacterium]